MPWINNLIITIISEKTNLQAMEDLKEKKITLVQTH